MSVGLSAAGEMVPIVRATTTAGAGTDLCDRARAASSAILFNVGAWWWYGYYRQDLKEIHEN